MARVDYDKMASSYDRGRSLTPEAIAVWTMAARVHIGPRAQVILDLGAGTGRFSAPLAEVCDADVIAVEPSSGMRGQAMGKPHSRVKQMGGSAEHLPLADGSIDAAWLSNVMHHFDDVEAAAVELRRVVVQDGPILVRGAFAERDYELTIYRFFPESEEHIGTFPSVQESFDLFERAGFSSFSIENVQQVSAYSFADAYESTKARADTLLESISDEAFESGLARLAEAARTEDGPVLDSLDLLVAR